MSMALTDGGDTDVDGAVAIGLGGEVLVTERERLGEEEYDLRHHRRITARRNFDKVNFGDYQMRTW